MQPISRTASSATRGGWTPVVLLCLWLAMEIGRPPYPLKIPLISSLTLAGLWIAAPRKRWDPVLICILGLLGTGWIGVPLAANQYSAFWACYGLTIAVGCISIPAAQFMKNMRHIHVFVWVFLATSTYVGLFAITHAGFGPAGAGGGQDENYVAAAMSAALPFAYFGLSATRNLITRLALMGMTVVFLLATVIGFSRGGFLGMAAVGLFCFWYSPRKLVAVGATIVGVGAVVAVAPDSYWEEVQTISETDEGTADMRLELWAIATRQFLDNPIVGVGPGNYRWRIADYQTEEQTQKMGRSLGGSAVVHSTYFEVLAELGGVGIGFFLAMLYFAFRAFRNIAAICDKALKHRSRGKNSRSLVSDLEWARAYALSFQGGLIGYLVCSAFISTTYYSTIWLLCAASVALHYAVGDVLEERLRRTTPPVIRIQPTPPGARLDQEAAPSARTPRLSELLQGRDRP